MSLRSRIHRLEGRRYQNLTHQIPVPSGADAAERAELLSAYLAQHPEAEHGCIIMPEAIQKHRPLTA